MKLIRDIAARRELLLILIGRNLKIRYKNSALGFFWSLLGPLLFMLIYGTFLRLINYPLHLPTLISGVIVWQFLATCTGDSLHAIVGNANLVTKASFPRLILPLSMVGANLVNFLLAGVVLVALLLAFDPSFGLLWLLPLVLLTHVALCLGLALCLSCANVFFRDTEHILSVVMLAWFFMTPVIYEPQRVLASLDPGLHALFFANPMAGIVTAYRMALLGAGSPGAGLLLLSFGVAWAVLLIGVAVFRAVEPRLGDEL